MRIHVYASALLALVTATAAHANLGAALQFVPEPTGTVYFTDWAAIRDDMRTVWPAEPTVGDTEYVRAMAERHAFVTSTATAQHRDPWYVGEQWGWTFLDLEWELETSARVVILRFTEDSATLSLLNLAQERGYSAEPYGTATLYSHAFSFSLEWLRPPFAAFQNVAFLEDEGVLILAATVVDVHAALDAYSGAAPSLADDGNAREIAALLDPSLGAVILTHQAACATHDPERAVPEFEHVGVGYSVADVAVHGVLGFARSGVVTLVTDELESPLDLFNPVLAGRAGFLGCDGPG